MLLGLIVLSQTAPLTLVFADEFDVPGRPNPAHWTYERGFVRNRELQWYQPENAWVEGGSLIIEARRERVKNPNFDSAASAQPVGSAARPQEDWKRAREFADYTSASVTTKGIKSWRYGRWEIRARLRPEPGLWPAIWTVGIEGKWPSNGEIDIMEFYQQHLHANTAYGTGGGIWDSHREPINHFLAADPKWATKFHTWVMEWTESSIKLSVDGKVLNETDIRKTTNPDGKNPFQQPHSLILNLAIGSTGGDPSKTAFPSRFEVDYVRIYQ